ncbi:MAG: hypothetical protein ACK519_10665 [Sphingomonadaceae bacterium]|jgi:hypothetical protein
MAEKVTPIVERDQLAAAVGYALDEWTQVEITLAFIFCSIFDDTKTPLPSGYTEWSEMSVTQRMLHSIMDAIIGFDTRIDVISAAVRDANISPLLKTIWGKLNARLKKKYKSRHQIAHFMILEIEEEGKPTCYRLTPFATSTTTSEEVRLEASRVFRRLLYVRRSYNEQHKEQVFS